MKIGCRQTECPRRYWVAAAVLLLVLCGLPCGSCLAGSGVPPVAATSPAHAAVQPIAATGRVEPVEDRELDAAIVGPLDWWPDVGMFAERLRDDVEGIATPGNLFWLALAGGGAAIVHSEFDERVRRDTAKHPLRWRQASRGLGYLGNAEVQAPILVGVCLLGQQSGDETFIAMNRSLIEAYTINGLGTLLIKAVVNSDRPSDDWNGGGFGFPSFHAAGSFTLAAVLDEYYGPRAGVPAVLLSGLISWSRIDERDHDLSDIVFGAAFGWLVGKAVSRWHREGDGTVRIAPWLDPRGEAVGGMVEWSY